MSCVLLLVLLAGLRVCFCDVACDAVDWFVVALVMVYFSVWIDGLDCSLLF